MWWSGTTYPFSRPIAHFTYIHSLKWTRKYGPEIGGDLARLRVDAGVDEDVAVVDVVREALRLDQVLIAHQAASCGQFCVFVYVRQGREVFVVSMSASTHDRTHTTRT